jgi:hypothetical protein
MLNNYPKNSLAGEIVKEGKVESTTIFGIHCCAAVGTTVTNPL